MTSAYDPVALLVRARALRGEAEMALPFERRNLLTQADAAEARANLSLETPVVAPAKAGGRRRSVPDRVSQRGSG